MRKWHNKELTYNIVDEDVFYMIKRLNELKIGEQGVIQNIYLDEMSFFRLSRLGVMKDNIIKAKFNSPFNDPVAYQVNNSIFTIRKQDAAKIGVRV